jgi:hypothetical protein
MPEFMIPPPFPPRLLSAPSGVFPLVIVRPDITIVPDVILKMRNSGVPCAVLRWTVRRFEPGPRIETLDEMTGRTVRRLIVAGPLEVNAGSKMIVPPAQTLLMASRREPAPLSAVVVTVARPEQVMTACGPDAPSSTL